MSLFDTKNDLIKQARKLEYPYEKYSINELADNYCLALDSNDSENQNIYLSALVLRFWYKINVIYNAVKTYGYDREDVFFKLYECINTACQYRAWQNPDKKTNAQACIMQTLSVRGIPAMIYDATLQKNTYTDISLDTPISTEGNSTFGETLCDETTSEIFDGAKDIVQTLIKNNKIIEAIVADTIANNDVYKHNKKTIKNITEDGTVTKYSSCTSEFWPFKVVQALNQLDNDYVKYFLDNYIIQKDIITKAVDLLSSYNNQKKYKIISKSLDTMKSFI